MNTHTHTHTHTHTPTHPASHVSSISSSEYPLPPPPPSPPPAPTSSSQLQRVMQDTWSANSCLNRACFRQKSLVESGTKRPPRPGTSRKAIQGNKRILHPHSKLRSLCSQGFCQNIGSLDVDQQLRNFILNHHQTAHQRLLSIPNELNLPSRYSCPWNSFFFWRKCDFFSGMLRE